MLKTTGLLLMTFAMIPTAMPAGAQEAVFIIRHAEKVATGEDPNLTDQGRERAVAWAGMLERAGIDHVITTSALRTRETGGIVADALDVDRTQVEIADVTGLVDLLAFDHAESRVLVVAHEETIPSILTGLGIANEIDVGPDDYANLFIVTTPDSEHPVLAHLRMPNAALAP